jgi:HPt (histidine-containing phosphotransfer) domain-containing protein
MSDCSRILFHSETGTAWRFAGLCLAVVVLAQSGGCSRSHYRTRADEDALSILDEKTHESQWSPPISYSIEPSPQSRLFDPSPIEDPILPDARPRLHVYEIPNGIGRRSTPLVEASPQDMATAASSVQHASHTSGKSRTDQILLARFVAQDETDNQPTDFEIEPVTIPPAAWESIPLECRIRMFEFESVLAEYENSYGQRPALSDLDDAPRLNLTDVVVLALLNSREYQAQKEQLYRIALRLSLQRFDYDLKFSPLGNRTGAGFEARSANGNSFNRLGIPTEAGAEALLNTGGTLVTRFANSVLLTFGGPDGFAADIGSELLFEVTHSVFQNDVRFERLTQAERDVVYAARDFARFRKTFYLQLTTQYYNLLRTYRQVEIDSQNYISLVRVYSQRDIELSEGEIARVQIDQVEQNALAGRSSLIETCNSLENALDLLKTRLGLPTETPINIDLAELFGITGRDEVAVSLELVHRVRSRLLAESTRKEANAANVLSQAEELVARMQDALEVQRKTEELVRSSTRVSASATSGDKHFTSTASKEALAERVRRLSMLRAKVRVAQFRLIADNGWKRYEESRNAEDVTPIRVPELAVEFARAVRNRLQEEETWARELGGSEEQILSITQGQAELGRKLRAFESLFDGVLSEVMTDRLEEVRAESQQLADAVVATARQVQVITDGLARDAGTNPEEATATMATHLLADSQQLLDESGTGLTRIRIGMDDASLAALAARLDLINARGDLADEWRGIKLAGDDLKSILNLQARQRLRTENDSNRPTEFDFDESRTELSITLDTPLNRRSQRNRFREQLLNYQLSRRAVMSLEDSIKQNIRSDLRTLTLAEEQHILGIASAALAYERVISTELQLRLGVAEVKARDFLEAQTAYSNSLSTVASRHIGHILGRIRLFVDLEQLQVDDIGNWPALHDESTPPITAVPTDSTYEYGDLPTGLEYSDELLDRLRQRWSSGESPQ